MPDSDRPGFYSLNHIDLAPILMAGAVAVSAEIARLKAENDRLESNLKTMHMVNQQLGDEIVRISKLLAGKPSPETVKEVEALIRKAGRHRGKRV